MNGRNRDGQFASGNTLGGRRGQSITVRLREAKEAALQTVIQRSAEGDLQAIDILLRQQNR